MGLVFLAIVGTLCAAGAWNVIRARQSEDGGRSDLAMDDVEPIDEEQLQLLGDGCTQITAAALECWKELELALAELGPAGANDATGAETHVMRGLAMNESVGQLASGLLDELGEVFEEPGWWLSHALEQVEAIATLADEAEALRERGASAVTRAAVVQGQERVEALLLAAQDFSARVLQLDLSTWVRDTLGGDDAKVLRLAVERALRRA